MYAPCGSKQTCKIYGVMKNDLYTSSQNPIDTTIGENVIQERKTIERKLLYCGDMKHNKSHQEYTFLLKLFMFPSLKKYSGNMYFANCFGWRMVNALPSGDHEIMLSYSALYPSPFLFRSCINFLL